MPPAPIDDHTEELEQLAGLHAMDLLEGQELQRFEQHVAHCERCRMTVVVRYVRRRSDVERQQRQRQEGPGIDIVVAAWACAGAQQKQDRAGDAPRGEWLAVRSGEERHVRWRNIQQRGAGEPPGSRCGGRERYDLVVIGGSAGGVVALGLLGAALPEDLEAAVCIVLHVAPNSPSALGQILHRSGPMPGRAGEDGDALRCGEILVAPPDRHLVIENGRVRVTAGPRENGHRPSVDTLFRSAAAVSDGQVIGVILTGSRNDGTAGLAAIKRSGGGTIVQDPLDARYPSMPQSAIDNVAVDVVAGVDALAGEICAMVNGEEAVGPARGEP